ncbi:MAG: hypothetical protein ACFFB7_02750, partial [Candidatus Sifarchaeia archaeon]
PHTQSASPLELAPPSILVYTEFVDDRADEEYENTMTAINNTYGTDYQYTNLTDYTNLDAQLPGKDILLIPEQENANTTIMKTVGTAWASTLTTFVNDGGVVVLLDFGNVTAPGLGLHIYNASGLMQIGPIIDQYPGGTLGTMHRHTFGDALCRRIAYQPEPRNNTMAVDITDGTVAVDIYQHPSNDLHDPIVVHKTMELGHVVFIGFDLSDPDAYYEQIVGNAIRLPNHVVFDASQQTEYRWEFPPPNPDGYQGGAFVDDLVEAGFAVSRMDTFDSGLFNASDVVICTLPYQYIDEYDASEIAALDAYVANGGSIFIQSDWTTNGDDIRDLANNFGYDWARDGLWDTDDAMVWYYESRIAYTGDNILSHPITTNVSRVEFYASDGFTTLPANAQRIIVTDWDGTSCWGEGGWLADWQGADGVTLMAVSSYGSGRVSVVLDGNFMDGTNGTSEADVDNDGVIDYFDSDNDRLLLNTIHWLAGSVPANDAPVLSSLSHTPVSPVNGNPVTVYVTAVDTDGLENITCHYRDNYGAWQNVSMTPEGGDIYSAAIGNFYDSDDKDYYIRAFDSSADKMESVSSVVYLNGINYFPSTPGLQDPGTTDDDGVFLLNWTASTDPDGYIDHYEIEMADSSWFTTILDEWNSSLDEKVITVYDNDTYWFRVRSVDDNGTKGFWCFPQSINVVIVEDWTGPAISVPALSPPNPVHNDAVTLSADISDPRGVKNATCYYRVNSGTWQSVGMTLGVGDEYSCDIGSFIVDDLIEYYIEAFDNSTNFNVANTGVLSFHILNQPPTGPILIDPGTTIAVSYFTLNWTTGSDLEGAISHYQLQMGASDDFTLILGEWNVTGTDRDFTGLSNGVYYFRVRTVDDHYAVSSWSNVESIEISSGVPTATTTPTTTTTLPFDPDILNMVLLIFSVGFVAILVLIAVNYIRQKSQKKYQF